tara:strand:+ start:256 stop:1503 length:1248 start_codon:yes stop_codon:yes gene_type:complete
MLIPGKIPKNEPLIRVGIILPEDQIHQTTVTLSDTESYEMETDMMHYPSCKNQKKITIIVKDNELFISSIKSKTSKVVFSPHLSDDLPHITLPNIVAGRGFHWQKSIRAQYWGRIELSILEGKLIVINELPLEQYLNCVATSEMSAACPPEFLMTQAIVARSWLLANIEQKHGDLGFDICNDDCCQRYQGINNCNDNTIMHINNTYGKVIIYDNKICDARYSKSCGGVTEDYDNVWSGDAVPYLISIKDQNRNGNIYCDPQNIPDKSVKRYIGKVDTNDDYFRWEYIVKHENLINSIKENFQVDIDKILKLNPFKRGKSGRIIKLGIDYYDTKNQEKTLIIDSEYNIRNILSESFLFSSAFTVNEQDGNFILNGKGWGHGVGLCQIGALSMALANKKSEEILNHYYPKTNLKTIY